MKVILIGTFPRGLERIFTACKNTHRERGKESFSLSVSLGIYLKESLQQDTFLILEDSIFLIYFANPPVAKKFKIKSW